MAARTRNQARGSTERETWCEENEGFSAVGKVSEVKDGNISGVETLCCKNKAETCASFEVLGAERKQISVCDEEWWAVDRSLAGGSICCQAKRQARYESM